MKHFKFIKYFSILFFVCLGALLVFMEQSVANEVYSPVDTNNESFMKPQQQETLVVASRECQEQEGNHCRGMGRMDCNKGHQGGKGCKGKGMMGHRGGMKHGMGHGMGHGPGLGGEAQCPQPRSTAKAPEPLFSKTNPLENTQDNIEKGRMLFQLDAQPSCTACHGSGNGLGMMSAGLNPSPRNFTCKETMESIPDGQLFWIIKNGSEGTGMPAFADLSDDQVWQLIHYIRQFSQ